MTRPVRAALAFVMAFALGASALQAQTINDRTETLTVTDTASGLTATLLNQNNRAAQSCLFSVDAADIRLRYDGTNPTASVGHPMLDPSVFAMVGQPKLARLRMIRQAGVSATVTVTCTYDTSTMPIPANVGSGGGSSGGGGGGGGDFDIATFQTTFGTTAMFQTASIADNLALTTDVLNVQSAMLVYDGTNLDLLRVGPAGTAATTAVTVQGIASMTPLLTTSNVTQLGGVAIDLGASTVGAGTQRVTVASDDLLNTTLTALLGANAQEDATAVTADRGSPTLCVQENTTPTTSGAAGDYVWVKCDSNARLYTNTVLYSAAGAALTLASDSTLDAAIGTSGPLSVGRGSTATPSAMSADNDATAFWLDLNGRLRTKNEAAEDAVAGSGDFGTPALCVIENTAPTGVAAAADYAWVKCDANQRVYTNTTLYTAAGAAVTVGTDYTHDVALTAASTAGPMTVGRGSTTPPTAVSTADDAVLGWFGLKGAQATFGYGLDPCASNGIAKSYAEVSSNADEISVALTSTQTIYICGFAVTSSGTTPTFRWVTGTGSACATSQTILTGMFAVSATLAPIVYGNGNSTLFQGDVSEDVCLDVGATTDVQGVLTYVKMVPPTL